jgi:hypothetical protein
MHSPQRTRNRHLARNQQRTHNQQLTRNRHLAHNLQRTHSPQLTRNRHLVHNLQHTHSLRLVNRLHLVPRVTPRALRRRKLLEARSSFWWKWRLKVSNAAAAQT